MIKIPLIGCGEEEIKGVLDSIVGHGQGQRGARRVLYKHMHKNKIKNVDVLPTPILFLRVSFLQYFLSKKRRRLVLMHYFVT